MDSNYSIDDIMNVLLGLRDATASGFSRVEAKLAEHDRRFDDHDLRFDDHDRRFDNLDRRIGRLETRIEGLERTASPGV